MAAGHFKNKKFDQAILLINKAISANPKIFELQYLMGLCYKSVGDIHTALVYLNNAIKLNPAHSECNYNLGLLLISKGLLNDAYRALEKVSAPLSEHEEFLYNKALCLLKLEQYQDALAVCNSYALSSVRLENLKGSIYSSTYDFKYALKCFKNVAALEPRNEFANINLIQISRTIGDYELAKKSLSNTNGNTPEYMLNEASILFDKNKNKEAKDVLTNAIEIYPSNVKIHENLNKLIWESEDKSEFLKSYDVTFLHDDLDLLLSYISNLILSKQSSLASQALQNAIKKYPHSHQIIHMEGVIATREGNNEFAKIKFLTALNLEPSNVRYLIDIANTFIQEGDYHSALSYLYRASEISPINQEVLAYQGLCWRLIGDERHDWLNDYDNLISADFLPTPDGFKSLDSFISLLKERLYELHNNNNQPLDQSVVNGIQTNGNLVYFQDKLVSSYKQSIDKRTSQYLDSLKVDVNHPIKKQLKKSFVYSGSWSVLLNNSGHHSNHVHPQGWISGPTYIDLPTIKNTKSKEGWIKFGETSLGLGKLEHIGKSICPEEGLSVLFPSYMWHGTFPIISSEGKRMTIAQDIKSI